jgi:hypothetical protein
MATTKRTPKRRSGRPEQDRRELEKLSIGARAEVARLLKRHQAGDITHVQLQTGLKEVSLKVRGMWFFLHEPK